METINLNLHVFLFRKEATSHKMFTLGFIQGIISGIIFGTCFAVLVQKENNK